MDGFFRVWVLPIDPIHNDTLVASSDSLVTANATADRYATAYGCVVLVKDKTGKVYPR